MTTCGYGDKTPFSFLGRTIGSILAFFGLLILSIPVALIGTHFL
jgi:hypothetical protein